VDVTTLTGKVMCGYQGWFNCEGDGAQHGWAHWGKSHGIPSPGKVKVDLWPDVSELGADEKFNTNFHHADGSTAQVFSSFNKTTALRHFTWMRDYGIDGVFVQRFVSNIHLPEVVRHNNTLLAHCREGANRNGRAWALMYDLSGLGAGRIDDVIEDWRALRNQMKIGEDKAYLHHRDKPLVAVWGVGFKKRAYTLDDCRRLIEALKNDGCSVMLGIPAYWREQKKDAITDLVLHDIIGLADVISPWNVGRYHSPEEVNSHVKNITTPDIAWCAGKRIDYLPVVFPGFSWHNMKPEAKTNEIPRLRGDFFWTQFREMKQAGATMLYVAMFDEVDEGTAIFKCTNDVPIGSPFVSYEGLPSDYYLRLTGAGARLLRGELPPDAPKPK
jgi:hypothetical protein